jgi:ornithine carbamoyltransferase
MAERLAAGDLAGFAQQLVPAVRRELDPVDATQAELQRVLAEAGRIRRLEQVEATPEKGRRIAYTFAVSAQKHSLRIRISLEEIHGRLFATSFVVEPAPADR